MTRDERIALCRANASKGGRAVAEQRGSAHMARIGAVGGRKGGPKGFEALAERLGDRGQAVAFLCGRGRMRDNRYRTVWQVEQEGAPV